MEIGYILGKEKVDAIYKAVTKKSKGGRKPAKKASDTTEAKASKPRSKKPVEAK